MQESDGPVDEVEEQDEAGHDGLAEVAGDLGGGGGPVGGARPAQQHHLDGVAQSE